MACHFIYVSPLETKLGRVCIDTHCVHNYLLVLPVPNNLEISFSISRLEWSIKFPSNFHLQTNKSIVNFSGLLNDDENFFMLINVTKFSRFLYCDYSCR